MCKLYITTWPASSIQDLKMREDRRIGAGFQAGFFYILHVTLHCMYILGKAAEMGLGRGSEGMLCT